MKKDEQTTESNTQGHPILSRRNFLAGTILIGTGLAIRPSAWVASAAEPQPINRQSDNEPDRGSDKMKTRKLEKLAVSEL
jgi:hypothetical protein